MTVQDYLDWASAQSDAPRTELINGQIVAMAAERAVHSEVKLAAVNVLDAAIQRAGISCYEMTDGPTVRIDDHTAYAPDALVYCGDMVDPDSIIVSNPVIVVEVLSPTSRHTDTSAKLIGYFTLPSVYHYLIIDPDVRTVKHHSRAANGTISERTLTTEELDLDPPGIKVLASDLFGRSRRTK